MSVYILCKTSLCAHVNKYYIRRYASDSENLSPKELEAGGILKEVSLMLAQSFINTASVPAPSANHKPSFIYKLGG